MEKTVYITEEEREKCRKVIDVFEELYEIEDEDILLVDVGRYGFVKLQCYTASHGWKANYPFSRWSRLANATPAQRKAFVLSRYVSPSACIRRRFML